MMRVNGRGGSFYLKGFVVVSELTAAPQSKIRQNTSAKKKKHINEKKRN